MSKGTCKAPSCDKEVQAKGYCSRHYSKWRKGNMPKPRYKTCNAENCRKPQERRSLCSEHYAKEYGKKTETVAAASTAAS
ncbi:MAG: vegetative protein [Deltaproteobacteria bacterium]|nr:vegetative protein [Deltaproteobacteria bacterium]